MATEIEISTRRYERIFGHKPHGFGLWYFQFPGGRVFAYSGDFTIAYRVAADVARRLPSAKPILVQVSA